MTTQVSVDWAGYQVDPAVAQWADAYADKDGVPRNVVRAITLQESGGKAVPPGDPTDNGHSAGPLQLNDQGQGAGMTVAQREDPETAFRVGVPYIATAWQQTSALQGVDRVKRTAALSGHPRDPQAMQPGLERSLVEQDLASIGSFWQQLEQQYPTSAAQSAGTAQLGAFGILSVPASEVDALVSRLIGWIASHRAEAAAIGITAGVVLWLS